MYRSLVVVVLASLLGMCAVLGQSKPDFSGEWVLNKAKSRLQFPDITVIDRGSMDIEHQEPSFKFRRVFVIGVEKDIFDQELTTDGREVTTREGKRKAVSRLSWDGDALVYATRYSGSQGDATSEVTYRLQDDGKVLEAVERFRSPKHQHENVWIFERK
jgi:hypothetical protein